MSETKTDPSETVLHFFTNNGGYYSGFPGAWRVRYPDASSYEVAKGRTAEADIPHAQLGEQDTRAYGVELVGNPWEVLALDTDAKSDKFPDGYPTEMRRFITETNVRSNRTVEALARVERELAALKTMIASLGK